MESVLRPRGSVATIDSATASPPPSPLAPVDLADTTQVANVMEIAARVGDILLASGTPNRHVHAQMHTVTSSYGLHYVHIDITLNTITLFTNVGRQPVTVFRVSRGLNTNFSHLTEVDRLIRSIRAGATPPEVAEDILDGLLAKPQKYAMKSAIWGWGLFAGAIALTLGAGVVASVAAWLLCMVIMAINTILDRNGLPAFFQQIIGGLIATIPAAATFTAAQALGIPVSPSQIIASGIVVLVAGLSLVQSIQDAIMGASVTGTARFFDTMLMTAGIVAGVALGIRLSAFIGMPLPPLETYAPPNFASTLVRIIGASLACMGFAWAMFAEKSAILISGLTGLTGMTFFYLVFQGAGMGLVSASGFTAMVIGLAGGLLARRYLIPPVITAIAGVTPMLPGVMLYRSMYALMNDQLIVGMGSLLTAVAVAGALAAGVVLGEWVASSLRRPRHFRPYRAFKSLRKSRCQQRDEKA